MFSKRLKLLREDCGYTQQMLADKLNVSRATIAGYETKGKEPDYNKLKSLCEIFNVSADYILGISDIKKSKNLYLNINDLSNQDKMLLIDNLLKELNLIQQNYLPK